MRVGVPKELAAGERRVALVPETVARLASGGFEVVVESGAGAAASFSDEAYAEAGAKVEASALDVLRRNDGHPGHVFNLGHGVLPETDPDTLRRLVELVHAHG